MLVAFSNQDQTKLQIVAGSMRDAFGVQNNVRYSGIIEVDGLPTRPKLKNAAHITPEDASATPTPDEQDRKRELRRASEERPRLRARRRLAAPGAAGHAGDRRSLQAHHDRGDQGGAQYRDRRSGRPLDVSGGLQGALRAHPPAHRRSSPAPLKAMPYPGLDHRPHLGIASCRRKAGLWSLGTCPPTAPMRSGKSSRKKAFRRRNFYDGGRQGGHRSRCFPRIPYIAANRRVTITLMREAPPVPPGLQP